jgi:hypothetical protein
MAAAKETLIGDDELDALMAELEAETTGSVVVPEVKPVISETPKVEAVAEPAPVVAKPAPAVVTTEQEELSDDLEKELEALNKEMAAMEAKLAPTAKPAPTPAPKPAPVAVSAEPEELEGIGMKGMLKTLQEEAKSLEAKVAPEPKPKLAAVPTPAPAPQEAQHSIDMPDESVFPVPSTVKGLRFYIDPAEIKRDLSISDTDLDTHIMQQSSMRVHYAILAAHAEAQHARIKASFDKEEKALYDTHRKALIAAGEKVTENLVDAAVKLDPRWLKGKNLVIESETIAAIAKSAATCFSDKRDMLIQLGADRREEGKGQLRIMAAKAEQESVRERAMSLGRATGT